MSCLVMGVLNVTPDSFSDGGRWFDRAAAVAHGRALVEEGADIVDVGGESTRPGAEPVDEAEELRRVIPVVEELASIVRVSIDTRKPAVAAAAVAAGATIVNDVSASIEMAGIAAAGGAGWIAMHMRGDPRTMQDAPVFCTPRIDMQRCSASRTTNTPRGSRHPSMASAIWVVSRSCTCGRFE